MEVRTVVELVAKGTLNFMQRVPAALRRLRDDEDGAMETSQIIILAFVAIPLILGLFIFGQYITNRLATEKNNIDATNLNRGGLQ